MPLLLDRKDGDEKYELHYLPCAASGQSECNDGREERLSLDMDHKAFKSHPNQSPDHKEY